MSLVADGVGLGAALAVAVGSGIQAVQAFDQLNDETPLATSWQLLRSSFVALFTIVFPRTNATTMDPLLRNLKLGISESVALTGDQVKNLKKWLSWFLGWFFISLGALAALGAAAVTLAV
jgi:hypothetical protein